MKEAQIIKRVLSISGIVIGLMIILIVVAYTKQVERKEESLRLRKETAILQE